LDFRRTRSRATGGVAFATFRRTEVDTAARCAFHSSPGVLHMKRIHSLLVNRNDHAWAAGLCVWGAPPASAAKGAAAKQPLGGVLQSCDIWNAQHAPAAAPGAAIPFFFANKASAAESKCMLIVHSFSDSALPVALHSSE